MDTGPAPPESALAALLRSPDARVDAPNAGNWRRWLNQRISKPILREYEGRIRGNKTRFSRQARHPATSPAK
jgi:hypothetical protein